MIIIIIVNNNNNNNNSINNFITTYIYIYLFFYICIKIIIIVCIVAIVIYWIKHLLIIIIAHWVRFSCRLFFCLYLITCLKPALQDYVVTVCFIWDSPQSEQLQTICRRKNHGKQPTRLVRPPTDINTHYC